MVAAVGSGGKPGGLRAIRKKLQARPLNGLPIGTPGAARWQNPAT